MKLRVAITIGPVALQASSLLAQNRPGRWTEAQATT